MAQLAQKNVIVVSASGNSFYNFGSAQGVAYPSADPNSLSIGAVYDSNVGAFNYGGAIAYSTASDRITPFSQRHQTLTTILAPGALTTGAHYNGGTNIMQGTSQAAPHIAGIAVLAQQLAVKELGRRLTQNEFSNLLNSSGITINDGDDENDNVINTGLNFKRVDMLALAKAIHVNQAPEQKIHLAGTNTYRSGSPIKDVFTDPDGDLLTYTATKSDGTPLPTWLQFSFNSNNNTITFTEVATPPSNWQSFQVKLTATDPCSANASQTFWIVKQSSGWVIDGYIAGATIFFDGNKNGEIDNNEPSTTTDDSGAYQLDISPDFDTNKNGQFDPEEGYLVAFGGTDTATGLP